MIRERSWHKTAPPPRHRDRTKGKSYSLLASPCCFSIWRALVHQGASEIKSKMKIKIRRKIKRKIKIKRKTQHLTLTPNLAPNPLPNPNLHLTLSLLFVVGPASEG